MTKKTEVRTITDKQQWERFNLAHPQPQFMQSWNAGLQSEAMGEEIVRLGLFADGTLVSTLFGSIIRAKRGSYLFVPYGPTLTDHQQDDLATWASHLRQWGRETKLDFIRFCPFLPDSESARQAFAQAGFRVAPIHTLAERIWLVDVGPNEETLLLGMSKTTRNLIRRGIKDGVRVTMSTDAADVDRFLQLHVHTKQRHAFTPYPDKLFREQVNAFRADNQVAVLSAYHGETLIASAIIMYYGGMASYHHGASIPSKIPAAYVLQWEAIREAKRRGCHTYNFWGVTDLKDHKHPFYGISLFKTRFGGRAVELLKGQDLALSSRYAMTWIVESIRRIKRGFGIKRT